MSDDEKRAAVCSRLAKILREIREERSLSMTDLAKKAGLSRAMISFVEHELRNPTLDTLLRICAVLNVDLADLLVRASLEVRRPGKK